MVISPRHESLIKEPYAQQVFKASPCGGEAVSQRLTDEGQIWARKKEGSLIVLNV